MDVIGLAAAALKPISDEGTIVQQGWYDESLKRLHVTLWKLQDTEDAHSDDECEIEAASIQVNIWSRSDQQALVKRIKKLILRKHFFLFLKKKSSNILNCSGKLFPEALARIC